MHETKLLKLLGISLLVGILGLTGFCKKSKDNNDLALVAGLVVAQQQAEQAAQAAYEAANNTENRQSFCAQVTKFTFPTDNGSNSPTYIAKLTPLVAQDCNVNYWGSSTNAFKRRLLEKIDSDADLRANCPNTRNAISNYDFSFGGAVQEKFNYENGKSLLTEVNLSTTTYTVVSPNIYKRYEILFGIFAFATDADLNPGNGYQSEDNCKTAVQNKINSIPGLNTFCSLIASPSSTCPSGQTKVVSAMCAYGDLDIDNDGNPDFNACATLRDQF
jgi:hypothetical protein